MGKKKVKKLDQHAESCVLFVRTDKGSVHQAALKPNEQDYLLRTLTALQEGTIKLMEPDLSDQLNWPEYKSEK